MKTVAFTLCAIFLIQSQITFCLDSEQPTKEGLQARLEKDPEDRYALYNLALMLYLDAEYAQARDLWKRLKVLEPDDMQLRTKLIQVYCATGEFDKVEEEVTFVREAWASGKHPELAGKDFFIRDQIVLDDIRVYVFDYYELKGERPLVWKFHPTKDKKFLDHFISLGSYDSTTAIMRETGSIPKDARAYHLDGYHSDGSHSTYGMFAAKPDYESTRATVIKILKGEKAEISSTRPAPAEEE